jgi:Protein of unknown function DUF262
MHLTERGGSAKHTADGPARGGRAVACAAVWPDRLSFDERRQKSDMAIKVNLDALIAREDFDAESGRAHVDESRRGNELYLTMLTPEARLASIRKPEFQRETSAWTPQIVAEFIRSVADRDVIPAIIMWRSPLTGKLFVIDGSQRLSALIAWIIDDYGDREQSQKFLGYQIAVAQSHAATFTRDLVEKDIGKYRQLRAYAQLPDTAPNNKALLRSRRIANDPLYIQWGYRGC